MWARLVLVFFLFFLPTIDTDLGWHLRYGEYFLNTGQILRQNTLTYFLADYSWAHPYTLYQIVTAVLYRAGGLSALSAALAFLVAVTYILFEKINPKLGWINLLVFLAIVAFGWNVFHLGWRAQIFTFVGLVLIFYLLNKLQEQGRDTRGVKLFHFPGGKYTLLFLLFALWANFHGGFVSGLVILAAATLNSAFQRNWLSTRNFALAIAVATATVFINPYGIQNYFWVIDHAKVPLQNLIAEWVPPRLGIKAATIATAAAVIFLVFKYKREKLIFWGGNLLFFAYLLFDAKRATPLFGLVAALALLDSVGSQLAKIVKKSQLEKPVLTLTLAAVALLLFLRVPKTADLDTNWKSYCTKGLVVLPCRAVEYVRTKPPNETNVYSAYEWGGFLEWQLPQYKFFVDGRMPAWKTPERKSPYTIYLEIIQARPGWEEKLNSYGTDWLLIGNGTFLDIELTNNPNTAWKETYRDTVAAVYTRKLQ